MDTTGNVVDELKGLGIQLANGGWLWFDDPQPDDIKIEDIASALSKICRYTGHCNKFYSVAQHSVMVSQLVPFRLAMAGLLHDATEAYIGDMSRPLKQLVRERAGDVMRDLENGLHKAISGKFNIYLTDEDISFIKWADNTALATEKRDLLPEAGDWPGLPDPVVGRIEPLGPEEAEIEFMNRYDYLIYKGV